MSSSSLSNDRWATTGKHTSGVTDTKANIITEWFTPQWKSLTREGKTKRNKLNIATRTSKWTQILWGNRIYKQSKRFVRHLLLPLFTLLCKKFLLYLQIKHSKTHTRKHASTDIPWSVLIIRKLRWYSVYYYSGHVTIDVLSWRRLILNNSRHKTSHLVAGVPTSEETD